MPPPKYPIKPYRFSKGNPGVRGTARGGAARRTPPGVTAPPPPKPPAPNVVGGYSAESEADRIIAELLAELGLSRDSARREAERTAQGEIARAQALSQALQALGIPGQIQNIYGNSAQAISGLAQGFSGDVQGLASQGAAEQANMVAGTGQEGAVRNEGAAMGNVLYGLEGYIPARGLEQMGAAFASEAALQPGFTQQFGQLAASKVMQDFVNEVLPEFTSKEAEIRTKRPSLVADARDRQRKETFELYEAGLLTQRQMAKRLGLPNWKKYPNVIPGSEKDRPKASASLSKAVGYLVDEFGNPILNTKGRPIPLPKDPEKWEKIGSAASGYWMVNPNDPSQIVPIIGPAPKAPKAPTTRSLGGGWTRVIDPYTGQVTDIPPPTGFKSSGGGRKLTGPQQAKFRKWSLQFAEDALKGGFVKDANGNPVRDPNFPPLSLGQALQQLQDAMARSGIPGNWNLAKSIVTSYYKKHYTGPFPPGKGKPATGGRKGVSYNGPDSLDQSLWDTFNYALEQGFTNLGTHNPSSKLPGGGISDHAVWPARAFDLGFSGGGGWRNAKARRMFQWLIKQPGVEYVILGDRIWSRSQGLHAYTSGGHDGHIHVSGIGSSV